jgi:hypothetical protein
METDRGLGKWVREFSMFAWLAVGFLTSRCTSVISFASINRVASGLTPLIFWKPYSDIASGSGARNVLSMNWASLPPVHFAISPLAEGGALAVRDMKIFVHGLNVNLPCADLQADIVPKSRRGKHGRLAPTHPVKRRIRRLDHAGKIEMV